MVKPYRAMKSRCFYDAGVYQERLFRRPDAYRRCEVTPMSSIDDIGIVLWCVLT